MGILYVTSFDAALGHATGFRLVESFLSAGTEGRLLICDEQDAAQSVPHHAELCRHKLEESELLHTWLASNRDIIPEHLGGHARPCDCASRDNPGTREHRVGCHWDWFNKNASRWFRKIAALDYALQWAQGRAGNLPAGEHGFEFLVWLDSDCRFKKRLPASVVVEWFSSADVFFHKSPDREVLESGVLGIRINEAGGRFLQLTTDRYRSGRFRDYERWDDGFHFQLTLDEHPEIAAVDLAWRATGGGFVVPHSPAGKYIRHHKGIHKQSGIAI